MTVVAPRARICRIFSCDILSGITRIRRYPLAAATRAKPRPVLPAVASMSVPPGLRSPERSAASTMANAIRSFIEPVGFWFSSFIKSRHWPLSNRVHSTRGVLPISERMAGFFNEATWRVPELIPLVSGGDTSCVKQDQRARAPRANENGLLSIGFVYARSRSLIPFGYTIQPAARDLGRSVWSVKDVFQMNSLVVARQAYAERLRRSGPLKSERVVQAFATVPRERFVGCGPWRIIPPGRTARMTPDSAT